MKTLADEVKELEKEAKNDHDELSYIRGTLIVNYLRGDLPVTVERKTFTEEMKTSDMVMHVLKNLIKEK